MLQAGRDSQSLAERGPRVHRGGDEDLALCGSGAWFEFQRPRMGCVVLDVSLNLSEPQSIPISLDCRGD